MTPAEIVEALRLARLDRTLSLRAVCAATGVPVSSLSEWEWRRHDPTLSSLDRWARALGFELTLTSPTVSPTDTWRTLLADLRRVGWHHTARVAEAGCDPDTGAHLWAYEHTWKRGTEAITAYIDYPDGDGTEGFVTWWTPDVAERQWNASLHVDLIRSPEWLRIAMSALGILTPPTVSPSGSGTPPS